MAAVRTFILMCLSPLSQSKHRGFTLIELLVVVTIIAILAALFLPVYGAVTNSGRKTQAISDEHSLMTAVFAYMGDHNNQLPANSDQIAGALGKNQYQFGYDTCYGDPGSGSLYPGYELMDILRGIPDGKNLNNVLNPSQTVYFAEPYVKNPTEPRSGILKVKWNDGSYDIQPGSFVDPWGSEYVVWLDVCRDGDLNDGMLWFYPNFPPDTDPGRPVHGPFGSVQIGSLGADGNWGKNGVPDGSDDVLLVQ